MTWQQKHDIVLEWIYSCKTYDQLIVMARYVKRLDYRKDKLIFLLEMKLKQIEADILVRHAESLVKKIV